MAATVQLTETNGAGATVTHGVANANMGSVDAAALNAVDHPITPGQNTYEKYHRLEITDMGGSSSIKNIIVYRNGSLGGAAVHKTNARTTSYGGAASYATPVATTSSVATQTMPSSNPGAANLGIGGSLTGALTAAGYSDYLIHQIQTNAADTAGSTSNLTIQYDEIA